MDEKDLQIFLTLADTGNLTRTAEKLYLSEGSIRQYVNQIYGKLHIDGQPRAKRKLLLELLAAKN